MMAPQYNHMVRGIHNTSLASGAAIDGVVHNSKALETRGVVRI